MTTEEESSATCHRPAKFFIVLLSHRTGLQPVRAPEPGFEWPQEHGLPDSLEPSLFYFSFLYTYTHNVL